jgi:hypothetical protein
MECCICLSHAFSSVEYTLLGSLCLWQSKQFLRVIARHMNHAPDTSNCTYLQREISLVVKNKNCS